MGRYVLNPATPVLLRPDGGVQVGWDPRRAVLVRPPSGLSATALADLLRRLQSGATLPEIQKLADGMTADAIADLVSLAGRRRCRDDHRAHACARGIHPDPRPRAAVGSARRGAALLRRPDHPQQPHECRRAERADRPGGADGLPGVRPAGGARPARRRRAAPSGAGARRHRSGRAAGHSRGDQLPGLCGSASQRPRCRLARGGGAAARHRAAAPTGRRCWQPRRWRSTRSTASSVRSAAAPARAAPPSRPRRWTPRWSSTSTWDPSWRAAGPGIRVAPADSAL